MATVRKQFIYLNGRAVHYRYSGSGPAVVLLHASPISSRVYEPMMHFLGDEFSSFAIDTPGNGLSDPLPNDDAEIADYTEVLVDAFDQLGIEQCIVYGRHTGASLAVELAARHPARVSVVITDGYPVFSSEQRDAYLNGYLNDLPLEEDGSHLTWLWARYRDQFAFWPWSKRDANHRADTDMPTVDFIQDGVIALAEAGNNYKMPYRAVFKHEAMRTLERAEVPVCITARPNDSLYKKFADFPSHHWRQEMPRDSSQAMVIERNIMRKHLPAVHTTREAQILNSARLKRSYVDIGRESLHVVTAGDTNHPVLVLLASIPGTVMWQSDIIEELAEHYRVIGIDPAACGESDHPADGVVTNERQAARCRVALQTLNISDFKLVCLDGSAGVGVELHRQCEATLQAMVLCDPLLVNDHLRASLQRNYAPDISLRSDGTHLVKLWSHLRDSMMWFPWFDRRVDTQRPAPASGYDYRDLQARFLMLFKQADYYQDLWQSAWAYPLEAKLAMTDAPAKLLFTERCLVPATLRPQLSDTLEQYQLNGSEPADIARKLTNLLTTAS